MRLANVLVRAFGADELMATGRVLGHVSRETKLKLRRILVDACARFAVYRRLFGEAGITADLLDSADPVDVQDSSGSVGGVWMLGYSPSPRNSWSRVILLIRLFSPRVTPWPTLSVPLLRT